MDRLGNPLRGGNGVSARAFMEVLKFQCPNQDLYKVATRGQEVFHHFTGPDNPKGVWVSGVGEIQFELDSTFLVHDVQ